MMTYRISSPRASLENKHTLWEGNGKLVEMDFLSRTSSCWQQTTIFFVFFCTFACGQKKTETVNHFAKIFRRSLLYPYIVFDIYFPGSHYNEASNSSNTPHLLTEKRHSTSKQRQYHEIWTIQKAFNQNSVKYRAWFNNASSHWWRTMVVLLWGSWC